MSCCTNLCSSDEPVDSETQFKSSNVICSKLTFPPRRVASGALCRNVLFLLIRPKVASPSGMWKKKDLKAQALAKERSEYASRGRVSVNRVSLVAAGTVAIAVSRIFSRSQRCLIYFFS